MKSAIGVLASLAMTSHALVARGAECSFGITAYGGPAGPVEQLYDGQNRLGQTNLPAGRYTMSNGGITDSYGRGCIITPPTGQWQCDSGASPTTGFSMTCNGTIEYNGESTFWSSATGDHEGWNIYSKPLQDQEKTVPVWLLADSCYEGCEVTSTVTAPCTTSTSSTSTSCTSSWPSTSTSSSSCTSSWPSTSSSSSSCTSSWPSTSTASSSCTTTAPAPKRTCPIDLPSNYEFPHLIVPVSQDEPNKKFGTKYNGTACPGTSSIFNFDLPSHLADSTCKLVFALPEHDQLETSAYELGGDATFTFKYLSDVATIDTTWNNMPAADDTLNTVKLVPGSAVVISEREGCAAGETVSFSMSAEGDSYINWFEDSNPCPIGIYVIPQ